MIGSYMHGLTIAWMLTPADRLALSVSEQESERSKSRELQGFFLEVYEAILVCTTVKYRYPTSVQLMTKH